LSDSSGVSIPWILVKTGLIMKSSRLWQSVSLQTWMVLNGETVQSWDDMQQMLEDGEIDMVTSPRKTQEREEKFDFSRPIGTNNGILTVRSDNSTIVDGNYSTYNGMRVALFNGSSEIKSFADFAGNKGFTYDPFYFDTTAEMEEALQSGNVDAIAASSLRKTNNERIVDKFDSSDFYVMVKKVIQNC